MLVWHRQLYLIDHGAALYFHHDWPAGLSKSRSPFAQIRQHVLRASPTAIAAVDEELTARLTGEVLAQVLSQVPDAWLPEPAAASRGAYVQYLQERLTAPRPFLEELTNARP
jgi:hypothetical protein